MMDNSKLPEDKTVAIVLAAGQGRRMNSSLQKQYMLLKGKPLIYYSLKAFEKSSIDEIILVVGKGEEEYCLHEIIDKYDIKKVKHITAGGTERYDSVYAGLKAAGQCGYVLIHDGARPLVTQEIIETALDGAKEYKACVIAMPVKDTIKIADEDEYAETTPDRRYLWLIQTPQAFAYDIIMGAYDKLFASEEKKNGITDDAMVVESMTDVRIKLLKGSYKNIKVTTPEDMQIAEGFI